MRFVFYLNGQQLDVYLATSEGSERLGEFPANESGLSGFSEFLQQQDVLPCHLLVDLIEEEFREETLPHVTGADKKSLHSRHAARLFRTTPFRHSRVLFREKTGRRDDHVLFSSLTNKDVIEPWLAVIDRHKLPLKGIHSLTVITRHLVDSIHAGSGNVLIITQQRGNNLRETFIKDGQVRFSRLAPLLDSDSSTFGVIVNAEVDKTKRYLNTLKLLGFNEKLAVAVISDASHLPSVQNVCHSHEQLAYSFHSIQDVAASLGLQGYSDAPYSDRLFVQILASKRIHNHYAQPEHLYHNRTYAVARFLRSASMALAAAALLWSGINIADALVLKKETRLLADTIEQVQQNLRQLTGATQNETVDPEDILAAVKLSDALDSRRDNPEKLLSAVGAALRRSPQLILDKLVWSVRQPAQAPDEDTGAVDAQQAGTINNPIQSAVLVKGHITGFNGSYLQANNDIRTFASRLSQQPGIVSTAIVQLPVNTASNAALAGKLLSDNEPGKAEFAVQVVMETRHDQG